MLFLTNNLLAYGIYEEKDLILQISHGDQIAFARVFSIYGNKLYSFIVSLSGSTQIAEDAVQDVFLKIWQKREELGSIDNFNCYLFRMAHNHTLNMMKRMARETLILSEIAQQSAAQKNETLSDIEFKDIRQLYHEAIETLPPQQKLVYKMSREDGLKQQEIATKLNISIATVKSHMTQAFRSLKKIANTTYLFFF